MIDLKLLSRQEALLFLNGQAPENDPDQSCGWISRSTLLIHYTVTGKVENFLSIATLLLTLAFILRDLNLPQLICTSIMKSLF